MKNIKIILIVLGISFSGCAVGPKIIHKASRANPQKIEASMVYVSDFKTARRSVAYTRSYNIHTVLETVSTYDNSYNIALELRRMGVNSEAVVEKSYEALQEGEYLLTGGAVYSQLMRRVPWEIFAFFTFVPIVFPMPVSSKYGVNAYYNYSIIDNQGRYVYQTGNEVITVKYGSHFWLVAMFRLNPPPDFVYNAAEDALAHIIAREFTGSR